jgi:hypothetical protein
VSDLPAHESAAVIVLAFMIAGGERAPPPLIEGGGSSLPQHSQSGDYAAVLAALSQSKNSARRGFFPSTHGIVTTCSTCMPSKFRRSRRSIVNALISVRLPCLRR